MQPPPTAYITYSYGNGEGHTSLNRTIRALVAAPGEALGALDRSNVNLMNIQQGGRALYHTLMNIQWSPREIVAECSVVGM